MTNDDRLYVLKNGRRINSPEISDKMAYIVSQHPERAGDTDTGYSWDEIGLADLFADIYKGEARFCPEHKSWYVYDMGRWTKDVGAGLVSGKLKEFTQLMMLYTWEIKDEDIALKYRKFLTDMGSRRKRDNVLKDAADNLRISATEFDSHPHLINCINGTFDLKEMRFREHDNKDFLTYQSNFRYGLKKVTCERWTEFITEITSGDAEKADYLQRALGYSLLGDAREECMFILYGKTTRNGKSTLLDAVEHLLGDYATVAPVEMICRSDRAKNAEAPSPVLAKLKGRRFVTMAESDTSGRLDESIIKQYTGGESITAREIYQSAITYKPQFTLWLSCNDLPAVRDKSLFASDRLRVIEFTRHFSEAEQDKTLKSYFASDEAMRGIFTWLVEGYKKYVKSGLVMPDVVKSAVEKYQRQNDVTLMFLEDKCVKSDDVMDINTLYTIYKSWCKTMGYLPYNMKKFRASLDTHPEWVEVGDGFVRGIQTI